MGIGYLLGGIFLLGYMVLVAYFGGIKKVPWILKQVKSKQGGLSMAVIETKNLTKYYGKSLGIKDVNIEEPTLEEVFMHYYE